MVSPIWMLVCIDLKGQWPSIVGAFNERKALLEVFLFNIVKKIPRNFHDIFNWVDVEVTLVTSYCRLPAGDPGGVPDPQPPLAQQPLPGQPRGVRPAAGQPRLPRHPRAAGSLLMAAASPARVVQVSRVTCHVMSWWFELFQACHLPPTSFLVRLRFQEIVQYTLCVYSLDAGGQQSFANYGFMFGN